MVVYRCVCYVSGAKTICQVNRLYMCVGVTVEGTFPLLTVNNNKEERNKGYESSKLLG